jgi:SAM-dependent methyltransferase
MSADRGGATLPECLREIQILGASIAADVAGLGRAGVARLPDVDHRLDAIRAALLAVRNDVRAARAVHLDEQLRRLGVAASGPGLRLHLGAGPRDLAGWINVDLAPASLAMDLRWGLPFAEGAADYVYACHVLEHFNHKLEVLGVVRDIRRVLREGGTLRVVVPDLEKYLKAYVAKDQAFFDGRSAWRNAVNDGPLLARFLHYAGAGSWPGALHLHKYGYDFETLEALLLEAGFSRVERSEFQASAHEVLRVDDASPVAAAAGSAGHYSLFVEATR